MSDRAVSQHRPTDANSLVERARGRGGAIPKRSLLRTFGPPALLLLCAVNLWWSRVGNWGVCLDGFRYSHADSITVTKGLFSHGGRLYFANSCKSGMYAGIRPKGWESRPVTVQAAGFGAWVFGPFYGSSRTVGVRTDEWERSGVSRLGFVATWEPWVEGAPYLQFPQRGVAVPWWFLVAVFSLTPIKDVAGALLRMWHRPPPGARPCPACRYDLIPSPKPVIAILPGEQAQQQPTPRP